MLGMWIFNFSNLAINWAPSDRQAVMNAYLAVKNRIGTLLARTNERLAAIDALPAACPLKQPFRTGYTKMKLSLSKLSVAIQSDTVVTMIKFPLWPGHIADVPTPYGMNPVNMVRFNVIWGSNFFSQSTDDRMKTVFHELFHLPAVGLTHPGASDPYDDPNYFQDIILQPSSFRLSSARSVVDNNLMGEGYTQECVEAKCGGVSMVFDF